LQNSSLFALGILFAMGKAVASLHSLPLQRRFASPTRHPLLPHETPSEPASAINIITTVPGSGMAVTVVKPLLASKLEEIQLDSLAGNYCPLTREVFTQQFQ